MPAKTKEAVKTGALFEPRIIFVNEYAGGDMIVHGTLEAAESSAALASRTRVILAIPADAASIRALREKASREANNAARAIVRHVEANTGKDLDLRACMAIANCFHVYAAGIFGDIGLPLPASPKRAGKGRGLK